jgi:hypothetical protein
MQSLIDYLSKYEWFRQYLDYILHMSGTELWLFVAITALLLIFIFYRWFGIGGLTGIVVFMFLLFVIFRADLYGMYLERLQEKQEHEQLLQQEMSKKIIEDPDTGSVGSKATDK